MNRSLFVAVFAAIFFSAPARALTPTDFAKQLEITISGYERGKTLTDLPVLVKLSESTITGFLYSDFLGTNGSDLRFTDANGTELAFDVERWDENGTSIVWVKAPSLSGKTTKIIAYYGNAHPPAAVSADVWSDYTGIRYLDDSTTATDIVVTRSMPKVYQATALIQVQPEHLNIDPYAQQQPAGYDFHFLRTQVEIIRSRTIMEEVVREMNLNEILGRAYGYYNHMSVAESTDRTVSLLRGKLGLEILRDTDLIAISIKLDKPDKPEGEAARLAASTANTVAKVFQEWTLRQSREDKEIALKVLLQEIDEQDRKIAAQEEKIRQLREKHGLSILTENAMTELRTLQEHHAILEASYNRERVQLRMPSTSVRIIERAKAESTPLPIHSHSVQNITLSVVAGPAHP